MKQFYALLALAFIFPRLSSAQSLAENGKVVNPLLSRELPASRSWEKEPDQVNGHISNARLSGMRSVTDAIVAFFHDSCFMDEQLSPLWYAEYFSEKVSPGPQLKFSVYCNFYEQKARLSIIANDISPLLGHLAVNNKDFLLIQPNAVLKNNCPYFESTGYKIWLVTSGNNQLPYTPVTRKEYLQEARMELINSKNSILADLKQKMPVHPAAVQAADKKAALEQLNTMYSGMDLQVRVRMFLKNYQTDEEYLKENADKGTSDLDSTLHLMDSLLRHEQAADLGRPAIVSMEAAGFRGFEDGQSDKMLIKMNPTYFNPYLSGEKPQFFLVCWNQDPSELMGAAIGRQLQERLDCQKLRALLGK